MCNDQDDKMYVEEKERLEGSLKSLGRIVPRSKEWPFKLLLQRRGSLREQVQRVWQFQFQRRLPLPQLP